MEGLRRPTKSRQGAKPDSAKPTQVGASTRRLSCIARQRLPIPSILSILSHSTPHPQPPHLYKCGGSHAANNEGSRSELHFAAIEACAVKTYAARSRQPFIPFSFAPLETSREKRGNDNLFMKTNRLAVLWQSRHQRVYNRFNGTLGRRHALLQFANPLVSHQPAQQILLQHPCRSALAYARLGSLRNASPACAADTTGGT